MAAVVKGFTCKAVAFLFMLVMSQHASAWWNDKWPYRIPINLDASITGADIETTQTEVPVLIRLHAGNFQDFFLIKEDLSDIRFIADDDKTPLKHSIESVDLVNQMIFLWVKLPQLTAGIATERVWMYYGNTGAVKSDDQTGVYDVNQALALTFSSTDTQVSDKTAYSTPVQNNQVLLQPASIIGGGAQFEGTQNLVLLDAPALRLLPESGATFSAWIKPNGNQGNGIIFSKTDGTNSLSLAVSGNFLYAQLSVDGRIIETPRTASLTLDSWQHVALVLSRDSMTLFINAKPGATVPVQWSELAGNTYIGASAAGENGFVGEMDEVRFDKIARGAGWLKVASENQGPLGKLLAIQPAEQLGGGGESNQIITVIITSLDEAGWAVIFVLVIMAIICWMVTIGKTLYIRQADKDNQNFLKQYKQLAGKDPAMLDLEDTEEDKELANSPIAQAIIGKHDHFQSSPIYHLYHRGIKEVTARIGASAGARAAGLTPHAVEAIRASLDSDMTREIQRLNSKMVVLTIAVSGGPFLGLLGTVVGVMITFGAIAATGDVNIAAIAPGVASALAATVAGLLVAIPALFAYNYLSLRIKDMVVDMRVFIDEFVARLAEYYGQ